MNRPIRHLILSMAGWVTFFSLLGAGMVVLNLYRTSATLRSVTEKEIRAVIEKNARSLDSIFGVMEQVADDAATAGEAFWSIRRKTGADVGPEIEAFLKRSFEKAASAIGGGIWYEPFAMYPDRKYFGPYVYRDKEKVVGTWDLSTPEYDYHNKPWYRMAIPADGPPKQAGASRVFWTEPYFDDAGTRQLMVTVDALMADGSGKIIGMSTLDFTLSEMQEHVDLLKITPGTAPFAVDGAGGRFIAFPSDPAKVMKPVLETPWGATIDLMGAKREDGVKKQAVKVAGTPSTAYWMRNRTGYLVGMLVPDDELYGEIKRSETASLTLSVAVIFVQTALAVLVSLVLVRRISKPLAQLTRTARLLADGDMLQASSILDGLPAEMKSGSSRNEIFILSEAFHRMTTHLRLLLAGVKHSGDMVNLSSTEIGTSARDLESLVNRQAISTTEISATGTQISATAEDLSRTMLKVGADAKRTTDLAEHGRVELTVLESAMNVLTGAASDISARLADINDKAQLISGVIVAIHNISEQVNLLSLNAAIEAEKAGEFGRGFAVVAREIRRLADKTHVSAQSIELTIAQMHAAVSAGVMGVDKFSSDVRASVTRVSKAINGLEEVIARVQDLDGQFGFVREGTSAQSEGAKQISEALHSLAGVGEETRESLSRFTSASEQLCRVVVSLQEEVSRFRLE